MPHCAFEHTDDTPQYVRPAPAPPSAVVGNTDAMVATIVDQVATAVTRQLDKKRPRHGYNNHKPKPNNYKGKGTASHPLNL